MLSLILFEALLNYPNPPEGMFYNQLRTIEKFTIYPNEIADFFKENKIDFEVKFKDYPNDSIVIRVKNYIMFKKLLFSIIFKEKSLT